MQLTPLRHRPPLLCCALLRFPQVHFAAALAGVAAASASTGLCASLANALGAAFGTPAGLAAAVLLPRVVRFNARSSGARTPADPRCGAPRARMTYAALAEALGTLPPPPPAPPVVPTDDDGAPEIVEGHAGPSAALPGNSPQKQQQPQEGSAAAAAERLLMSTEDDEADRREEESAESLVRALADMAAALGLPSTLSAALGPGFDREFLCKVDAVALAAFADQSTRTNPRAPRVEARSRRPNRLHRAPTQQQRAARSAVIVFSCDLKRSPADGGAWSAPYAFFVFSQEIREMLLKAWDTPVLVVGGGCSDEDETCALW